MNLNSSTRALFHLVSEVAFEMVLEAWRAPRFPEVGVENWTGGGPLVQAGGLQKSAGHAMFVPTEANNRERG